MGVGLGMHLMQTGAIPSTPIAVPAALAPATQVAGAAPQAAMPAKDAKLPVYAPHQPAASLNSPTNAEVIEAGCSFSGVQIEGKPGSTHLVACPAYCDAGFHILNGTDIYTNNAYICLAAIHAGLIKPSGGAVQVIIEKGRPTYRGSLRNTIQSSDFGKYAGSFRLAPANN